MIDGTVIIVIQAIRQRWQHVITHGKKTVGMHNDLSLRNESVRCCNYCNEVKFAGGVEIFLF
jgi:hypothetical protein